MGVVTIPVRHRTIEEIWYVLAGRGSVWRGPDGEIVSVKPGTALTIPLGTWFQFRADPEADLEMILTWMPSWPGDEEAIRVEGPGSRRFQRRTNGGDGVGYRTSPNDFKLSIIG